MFCSCHKKVSVSFIIISSIAATTQIKKIRANFLIKDIFKTKQCTKFVWYWKTTFRWQKLKLFFTDLTNLDLNFNDFFPINGSTHTNSFFRCKWMYLFIYENIIQKSFDTNVNKVKSITISFRNVLKIKYLLMKKFKIRTQLKGFK